MSVYRKSRLVTFKFNDDEYEIEEKFIRYIDIFAPLFDPAFQESNAVLNIEYKFDSSLDENAIDFIVSVVFDMITQNPLRTILTDEPPYDYFNNMIIHIVSLYDFFGITDDLRNRSNMLENIITYVLNQQFMLRVCGESLEISERDKYKDMKKLKYPRKSFPISYLNKKWFESDNRKKVRYIIDAIDGLLTVDFYATISEKDFVYVNAIETIHKILSHEYYAHINICLSDYEICVDNLHINESFPQPIKEKIITFLSENTKQS